MRFAKYHGLGNDFVVVDLRAAPAADAAAIQEPAVVRAVCDRQFGVGGDGVLAILPAADADARMRVLNADGSEAEMCGNGIRCVGKYVHDRGLAKNPLRIDTDDGVKTLQLTLDGRGRVAGATVDMGVPVLDGPRIPVASEGRVIDQPLEVAGLSWQITCVSMGNPHCVVFVPDVESLDLPRIGPRFEHHPFFPKRVNTEFIRVASPTRLEMRVWERGAAETMACGTGACAAAVAAARTGRAERRCTVALAGGELEIDWRADDHVVMTGDAVEVFQGRIEV